jgi:hypothetical protein
MLVCNINKQPARSKTTLHRYAALLLSVVIGLWMVLSATHVHVPDDHDAPGKRSAACSICLSLPAGASPPAQRVAVPVAQVARISIQIPLAPARSLAVLSSYLSRGPPAF